MIGGVAVHGACEKVIDKAKQVVAHQLEAVVDVTMPCSPEHVWRAIAAARPTRSA